MFKKLLICAVLFFPVLFSGTKTYSQVTQEKQEEIISVCAENTIKKVLENTTGSVKFGEYLKMIEDKDYTVIADGTSNVRFFDKEDKAFMIKFICVVDEKLNITSFKFKIYDLEIKI